MTQHALFHDTIFDAIGADIAAIGGFKVAAGKLWPSESPTTAAAKLRNAVNPEQPHKLCPDEVLRIKRLAKDSGSFATINYESRELGFEPTWKTPAEQLSERLRKHNELSQQLLEEGRELRDLLREQPVALRAVK